MTGDFLPEFKIMPAKGGGYRCTYRLFDGKPFILIPGEPKPTAGQALNAGKTYVRRKLNPPIRVQQAPEDNDPFGVAAWHEERAGKGAELQEAALGAVLVRGKAVRIERRRLG